MNSIRCGNCALLNFDTAGACKRCGVPFDSGAEQAGELQHYAPPQHSPQDYPQPAEAGAHFWDQPQYQPSYIPPRAAPAPSGGGGAKIVGVAVVLAVLSLVAFVAIPRLIGSKSADLGNVTWREYKAPDGSFTVTLPSEPKEMQMNQPTPTGTARVRAVMSEIGRSGACVVMSAEYPPLSKFSEDMLYEQALKNMASRGTRQATLGNRKFIMHDGHRGLEVEFKPKSSEGADSAGRMRLFIVAPRVYVVISGGPDTPEFAPVVDKCLDSFRFSSGQ